MKTKVVAFRVTQQEYDALAFAANCAGKKLSAYVDDALLLTVQQAVAAYAKEQKRLEAKAKRDHKKFMANLQANRDAKAATND
jgi:uncharacterized protein (DUF1778 family)